MQMRFGLKIACFSCRQWNTVFTELQKVTSHKNDHMIRGHFYLKAKWNTDSYWSCFNVNYESFSHLNYKSILYIYLLVKLKYLTPPKVLLYRLEQHLKKELKHSFVVSLTLCVFLRTSKHYCPFFDWLSLIFYFVASVLSLWPGSRQVWSILETSGKEWRYCTRKVSRTFLKTEPIHSINSVVRSQLCLLILCWCCGAVEDLLKYLDPKFTDHITLPDAMKLEFILAGKNQ